MGLNPGFTVYYLCNFGWDSESQLPHLQKDIIYIVKL